MRHAIGLSAVIAISSLASANPDVAKAPPPQTPPQKQATPGSLSETAKLLQPIQVDVIDDGLLNGTQHGISFSNVQQNWGVSASMRASSTGDRAPSVVRNCLWTRPEPR